MALKIGDAVIKGGDVVITCAPCFFCGERAEVTVTLEQYGLLQTRFVQDVFPHWSPDKRELLMTGTHGPCWAKAFGPESD